MRFGMLGQATMLAAATAGMAHGETNGRALPPATPQAGAAQVQQPNALGVCGIVNVGPTGTGQGDIFPVIYANSYYFKATSAKDKKINGATAKVTMIRPPKHGTVAPVMEDDDLRNPRYLPHDGFLGNDSFALQVEGNGYIVELHYFFYVTNDDGVFANPSKTCKGDTWKISTNLRPTLRAIRYRARIDLEWSAKSHPIPM